MKTLLLLIALLITITSKAQTIPKGAETIQLTTTISDSLLAEKVIALLNEKGFTADKIDIKRGTVITDSKATVGVMNMRVLVNIKNSVALFKGQWSGGVGGYTFTNEPVSNKGMMGSAVKKSFMILNEAVTSLSQTITGSTINYLMPAK